MNHTSEKAHELASILISVETVVEYDRLVTEFNLMQPTLRDHVQRVENITNGKEDLKYFLGSVTGDKVDD